LEPESLPRDATLEREWEETILPRRQDTCRHGRPCIERPRFAEHARPRRALILGTLASDGRVDVVEEDIRHRVFPPLGHWPIALDELCDRRRMPGVAPPRSGGLPGPRNHGRDQDERYRV